MIHHTPSASRGTCLTPTDPSLLGNPLDFIAEDHLRERHILSLIDEVAISPKRDVDTLRDILAFLVEELPLHLADEETDFYPLMRMRCSPEDEIEKILAKLHSDHEHSDQDALGVILLLRRQLGSQHPCTPADRDLLQTYANKARRHLFLENAVLIPLARARLQPRDLDQMRYAMLRRRGLDRLFGAPNAE